jgi:hypothetical protein
MLNLFTTAALLLVVSAPATATEQKKGVERLRDVETVYVADLGQTEKAKALRQEIIKELTGAKRVRVVNTAEEADAVLSLKVENGTKNVDQQYQDIGHDNMIKTGSKVVPVSRYVFRLNSRQDKTLWAVRLDSDSFSGKSERGTATAIANKVSREFTRAVKRADKGH